MCVEMGTIRHKDCQILLPPYTTAIRCCSCARLRSSLSIQAKRIRTPSRTEPSSHTNHRYLSRSELIVRLSQEHHQRQLALKRCQRLTARLEIISDRVGVRVDDATHNDLETIVTTESDNVLRSLPPDSLRVSKLAFDDYLNCIDCT